MNKKCNSIKYETIDHTADLGVKVYGSTLEELFINSALALSDLMTDRDKIRPVTKLEISLSGENLEELLVSWLGELIYLGEVKSILFSQFEIQEISSQKLIAYAIGERFSPSHHQLHNEIKAATYHQLKIEKKNDRWQTQIIFDV